MTRRKDKGCCKEWREFVQVAGQEVFLKLASEAGESALTSLVKKYGLIQLGSHCPICGEPIRKERKRVSNLSEEKK